MRGDERDFGVAERSGAPQQDRIDSLIDTALRSYAEPGEIPGARVVVARLMDRARAEKAARRAAWAWRWAIAVACGIALIVVLHSMWVTGRPRAAQIAWEPKAPKAVRLQPSLVNRSARKVSMPRAGSLQAMERPLPKMEIFPTPRPLTAQEEALLGFAQQGSLEAKKQAVDAQEHLGDPIVIAELRIEPLQSGEKQDSNKER